MTGYIPDPNKGALDYLKNSRYNAMRIPVGVLKILFGILTFLSVPVCLAIYLVLILFARRFMFSEIPTLVGDIVRFAESMIVTGFSDVFYSAPRSD